MPSREEKTDLYTWVGDMPKRENIAGYEELLKQCAERYGNTSGDLQVVLDAFVEQFKKNMHKNMRQAGVQHHSQLPPSHIIGEAIEQTISALLLRMWVYGNEYNQRWVGPELFAPFGDDELTSLLGPSDETKEE